MVNPGLVLVVLAGLTIAACGGGDDDDDAGDGSGATPGVTATATTAGTVPPGATTVTGPNGDVTVALPPGSSLSGSSIQISTLPPGEWPDELSAVDAQLVVEIGPDGAEFEEPVSVTLRLDAAQVIDPSAVFLIIRNADGSWESLADVTSMVEGDSVVVTGTTTHFTPVAGGNSAPGADAAAAVNEGAASVASGSDESGGASGGASAGTSTPTATATVTATPTPAAGGGGGGGGCFFTASGDPAIDIVDWVSCGATFIQPSLSVTFLRQGTTIGVQVPQFDGETGTYDALLNIMSNDLMVIFIGTDCELEVTLFEPDPSGVSYDVEGTFAGCSSPFGGTIDAAFSTVE